MAIWQAIGFIPNEIRSSRWANTHDEHIRDRANAVALGLPETAYREIMSYAATDLDRIRLVAVRHGLVGSANTNGTLRFNSWPRPGVRNRFWWR